MTHNWNKNKLTGNKAESIIEFLINSMPNWKCFRFGIENHIQELKEKLREQLTDITKKIRKMPDFIAFNEKTGETLLIEVKYSSYSKTKFLTKFLGEYNKFWKGTKLIIVRPEKPHFSCIDLIDLENKMCEMIQIQGDFRECWNFETIQKDIKEIFPDLKDDIIREAIRNI